ncbi:uncharacterized protein LOC131235589 isoform X2 [Magnolia sinica]|uniref:uncharacterized protein LOC131235589 isoform X2 n=1 Tax=Magnolia sinica TaxID=86752 RepID=UPI002659154A|nr:uncharacterized protein LOC131235589 isoform X2 [Magnolia sinica]
MAVRFHQQNLISSRSSNSYYSYKAVGIHFFCKEVLDLNNLQSLSNSKRRCHLRHELSEHDKHNQMCRSLLFRKHHPTFCKARRMLRLSPLASTDDGITVNGTAQASSSSDLEEMKVKLNQSLQGEDISNGLIQSLHDAARVFELAIQEHGSSKSFWFSKAWLGVDKNAWVKTVSYQAAVHSLLQAASEISSRGDGRDRDINVFVQRSLSRQSAPLDTLIRDELSAKQPEAYEWFWSQQHPVVVTTFVNYFERDPRFTAATTVCWQGVSSSSGSASDPSLLILALSCMAAITKLGPAKVSCPQFFSMVPDITGRFMDKFVEFVPIRQTYYSMRDIGLRREFLVHFGPRAASCRVKNDRGIEEIAFWVELIQQQLQRAIDREKIWSRLTTCESIEVLDKDLAIFGFFVALGRSTQSFLSANGFNVVDEPIESFIRYLIGGSVLYYPQLSSISSYQLYVEVVCEELEWLPFYPSNSDALKKSHEKKEKQEILPNREAIPKVLDVCSYWMQSFIKYSTWLENPSNIKAAKFLSRGHNKLRECMEEIGIRKSEMREDTVQYPGDRVGPGTYSSTDKELDSFDEALENVDEALRRLEELLQKMHVSSSNTGKEQLKAACSDLERIRKLKKEAEFLEASFRAKAASLQQGEDDSHSQSSISKKRQHLKRKTGKGSIPMNDGYDGDRSPSNRVISNSIGLWRFFVPHSTKKAEPQSSMMDQKKDEKCEQTTTSASMCIADSESNEIRRFELLRRELFELEKRVQRSTDGSQNEEENNLADDGVDYDAAAAGHTIVQVHKKEGFIGKSIEKLKETSTDVWQGTQLLAIDVAAAAGLLRRALMGDELTEKEKKALQRTITDLASVVPIGILMLLPQFNNRRA